MSLKYTGNQTERVYSPELNNIANVSKNAVLEGLTPTQNLGTDMNIKVAVGEYFFGLNTYEFNTASTVAVTSNSTSFTRIDTILINEAGTVSVLAGTAGAIPKPADYDPDDYIALGLITVAPSVTAITNDDIKDIRVLNVGGSGGSGAISTVSVFRESFTAQTSVTVTHGLDDYYPTVQVYDDNEEQITADSITIDDDDNVTVTFNTATTGTIVVMGGKAGISIGVNKYYEEFTSQTSLTVTHGLADLHPVVQVYNESNELITCDIEITDSNTVDLTFLTAQTGYVIIHGGITGEGAVVLSPGTVTDSDFAQFDGTDGNTVKGGLALQTTITDDDTKVPSSGAVVDYAVDLARLQTTITDDDSKIPSSGAVVDYVDSKASLIGHGLSTLDTTTTSVTVTSDAYHIITSYHFTPSSSDNEIIKMQTRYKVYSASYTTSSRVRITDENNVDLLIYNAASSSGSWSAGAWAEITMSEIQALKGATTYKIIFESTGQTSAGSYTVSMKDIQIDILYGENIYNASSNIVEQ